MAAPIVPPVVDVFNLYDDQRAENDMAVKLANTVTCGHQPHPNQHWSNTSNFNITKTRNRKLIWALHSLQTHFRAPINTVTLEAALTMHMAETLGPEQRDAFAFHVWGRNGPFDIDDTRFRAPAPDGTLHPGDQCLPLVEPQTAPDGTLRYGRVWERLRRSVWAFHPVLMMNKWVYICFRITNREEDGIPVMTTRTNNQLLKAEATLFDVDDNDMRRNMRLGSLRLRLPHILRRNNMIIDMENDFHEGSSGYHDLYQYEDGLIIYQMIRSTVDLLEELVEITSYGLDPAYKFWHILHELGATGTSTFTQRAIYWSRGQNLRTRGLMIGSIINAMCLYNNWNVIGAVEIPGMSKTAPNDFDPRNLLPPWDMPPTFPVLDDSDSNSGDDDDDGDGAYAPGEARDWGLSDSTEDADDVNAEMYGFI